MFKIFGTHTAVEGIDLQIRRGEFFSILGPSGCGKTTTLRLIAGFEQPSSGQVLIRGESMQNVPPYRRPVNTVFQSYALFKHMSVWDNVAFGLRIKNQGKAEIQDRVQNALRLVKMEGFAKRSPQQLSGGQQQRVALARALVNRPAVVLLDEPLGALDLKLRKEMQMELSNLHQQLGLTFVMVTHDQEEALSLSDRIAVMNHAKVEQIGSPSQIYEHPATPFVADFIGDTNLFEAKVKEFNASDRILQVVTRHGLTILIETEQAFLKNKKVMVSVRPEKIRMNLEGHRGTINCFEGRLKHVMYMGTHVHYIVQLSSGDQLKIMQVNNSRIPGHDTPIYISWNPKHCIALAP
jgi:spermidine/putrescine transport system ATP-binding protein